MLSCVYVLQDQPPLQPQKDFAILLTASTKTNPCPSKTVSHRIDSGMAASNYTNDFEFVDSHPLLLGSNCSVKVLTKLYLSYLVLFIMVNLIYTVYLYLLLFHCDNLIPYRLYLSVS